MKDLDAERLERHKQREEALGDRGFKWGGETFVFRANPPKEALKSLSGDEHGNVAIDALETTVLRLLEDTDDGHARFLKVCGDAAAAVPVTAADLNDLLFWLIQETTGSPTVAPSPYTGGGATTSTVSTGTSSSKRAAVSAD